MAVAACACSSPAANTIAAARTGLQKQGFDCSDPSGTRLSKSQILESNGGVSKSDDDTTKAQAAVALRVARDLPAGDTYTFEFCSGRHGVVVELLVGPDRAFLAVVIADTFGPRTKAVESALEAVDVPTIRARSTSTLPGG
jgi:hypothetical protein